MGVDSIAHKSKRKSPRMSAETREIVRQSHQERQNVQPTISDHQREPWEDAPACCNEAVDDDCQSDEYPYHEVTLSAFDGPETLVIEVLDDGIGIPPEDQQHIFEDFFRGGNVEEHGGSGLGLSIAKGLVEAHGGRIWAESAAGQGTTIFLTLPILTPQSG